MENLFLCHLFVFLLCKPFFTALPAFTDAALFECRLAHHFLRSQRRRFVRNRKRTDKAQKNFNPAAAFAIPVPDRFMDNDTICKQAQLLVREFWTVPKPSGQFQKAFSVILGGEDLFKLPLFRRNGFLRA